MKKPCSPWPLVAHVTSSKIVSYAMNVSVVLSRAKTKSTMALRAAALYAWQTASTTL